MRITGRNLNQIKTALAHRSIILDNRLTDGKKTVEPANENLYGENVKIVRQYKLNLKLLTTAEKDGIIVKYKAGMMMTAMANLYGCYCTTIGRFLRMRGVEIRKKKT